MTETAKEIIEKADYQVKKMMKEYKYKILHPYCWSLIKMYRKFTNKEKEQ